MKKLLSLIILGLFFIVLGCEKDEAFQSDVPEVKNNIVQLQDVPHQQMPGEIPEATVQLRKSDREMLSFRSNGCDNPLIPDFFEATLYPGESTSEIKEACIPPIPPKADILWSFDLTGSMGDELNNVKINCENIAIAIQGAIPDCRSGLISHMDYPDIYTSCDYSNTYGDSPDYPYSLDQTFTADWTDMHTAIGALNIGWGVDYPENYARAFYEAYSDPLLDWRDDAAKILVAFLDALPHDCELGTGDDPGPDGIMGTGDELDFDQVLLELASNNIHLVVVYSGPDYAVWENYAANPNHKITTYLTDEFGNIPSGVSIEDFIIEIISGTTATVHELMLELGVPEYSDGVFIDPPMYSNVSPDGGPYMFEVTFTVPEDAEPGVYTFPLYLKGDGAIYDEQLVTITVPDRYVVPVDIKPTSCPNPLNTKSGGVLPVAVMGTDEFNVSLIDPETVKLMGIEPLRYSYEDVGTPYYPFVGKEGAYACTEEGRDGIEDMTFKFNKKLIASAIGPVSRGEVIILPFTALTYDGVVVEGEDVMIIVK
jgi:hypothetical protein